MTRESASVGPTNDSVAGAYQRDDPAPVTRLAALLREALNDYGQSREDHPPDMFAYVAARLIAQGVRVPTEAGASVGDEGLWRALVPDDLAHSFAMKHGLREGSTFPQAEALERDLATFLRAALAAQPAPTLDRERLARALQRTDHHADSRRQAAAIADAYEAEP